MRRFLLLLGLGVVWLVTLPLCVKAGQVQLIQQYASDTSAFTQGLEVNTSGDLILATGQKGHSYWGRMDLVKGQVMDKVVLPEQYFGEGITVTPDALWQLTYTSGQVFKWDQQTHQLLATYTYEGEGWGLAYDPKQEVFWMTNGSELLQQRSTQDFTLLAEIPITYQGKAVPRLNELEWVEGKLYGNIWQTNLIVCLDPNTGVITDKYDLTPILDELHLNQQTYPMINVLNGIAHMNANHFYITGKYYPLILEVAFIPDSK